MRDGLAIIAILFAIVLTACGGGGDDDESARPLPVKRQL